MQGLHIHHYSLDNLNLFFGGKLANSSFLGPSGFILHFWINCRQSFTNAILIVIFDPIKLFLLAFLFNYFPLNP